MAALPLTRFAHGSTRCPGCRERFSTTNRATTDVVTSEHYTRKGGVHLGETREVTYRWHTSCRDEAQAFAQASRQAALDRQIADAIAMYKALGLPHDEAEIRRMISGQEG